MKVETILYLVLFLFAILVIILLLTYRGLPNKIEALGFTWDLKDKVEQQPIKTITETPKNEIKKSAELPRDYLEIAELQPRQKIYSIEDRAYVDFKVNNPKISGII